MASFKVRCVLLGVAGLLLFVASVSKLQLTTRGQSGRAVDPAVGACSYSSQSTLKMEVDAERSNAECHVPSLLSNKAHMVKYNRFMKTLRTVIPDPIQFSRKYINQCWTSPIDLTAMLSIKQLRKRHFMKNSSLTDAVNLYKKVMSLQKSELFQKLVCLPAVFLPSFPKSGSTLLYRLVTSHPLVKKPHSKECHWWTRFSLSLQHPYGELSVLAYLQQFHRGNICSSRFPKCLVVDGSQSLFWDSRRSNDECMVPHLLQTVLPKSKFVVIMRDPVYRLYSEYWYISRVQSRVNKSSQTYYNPEHFHCCVLMEIDLFQKCLAEHSLQACTHSFLMSTKNFTGGCRTRLGIGIYYIHIARWLNFFPREQFLFLRYQDLLSDTNNTLSGIWKFLNLPDNEVNVERAFLLGTGKMHKYSPIMAKTEALLRDFYHPFNHKLAELTGLLL